MKKAKPTLDEFLRIYGLNRSDVFTLGNKSKRGVLSDAEIRLIYKIGAKLLTKKWNYLWDEYFEVSGRGATKAVDDLRGMFGGSTRI